MKLADSLHDAVADVSTDLSSLVVSSRRQGLALRRRRRALTTVGTAAAAVAIGGAVWAVNPGGSPASPTVQADDLGFAATPTAPATVVPPTGRAAAAALAAAVGAAAGGVESRFGGIDVDTIDQAPDADKEYYAELFFQPGGLSYAGKVSINVQPLSMAPTPYVCDTSPGSYMKSCTVETLPNGDIVRTYDDFDSDSTAGYRRSAAELISTSRHVRVIAGAENLAEGKEKIAGPDPVLTQAQLAQVVEQPWWNLASLPAEYAADADRLPSYIDRGGNGDAWPLTPPPAH